MKDVLESLKLLEGHGIPVAQSTLCSDVGEALEFAGDKGYPIVLKVVNPEIVHKTEAGGVEVCGDEKGVETAFAKINEMGDVLVQEGLEGTEVIVGVKKDPVFGHAVMLGLGGVFVELYDDVTFRMAPVEKKEALSMVDEIKGGKLLKGFRGKKGDVDSLADVIVKTSKLAVEEDVKELDINPLFVWETGVAAADARVELC